MALPPEKQSADLDNTPEVEEEELYPPLKKYFEFFQPRMRYKLECEQHNQTPDPRVFVSYLSYCVANALGG
ncbi:hypothetical protein BN7874_264 [Phage NCTB]|nr:hypothetical protein BN7874_264 [Phage NCTB]